MVFSPVFCIFVDINLTDMKKLRIFTAAACCILIAEAVQAQTQAVFSYGGEYLRAAGDNAALYNGRIQAPMPDNIESLYLRDRGESDRGEIPVPVSPDASYATGNIFYDGVLYTGVRMRLDLCRDELVAAGPSGSVVGAVLVPDRLSWADVRGYRVVRPPAGTCDIPEGYCLQLHSGSFEVLKKESYEYSYSQMKFTNRSVRYYVVRDGVAHRVGSKGSVLRLLKDRRAELDRFVRTGRPDFRRNADNAIVAVVREYERLTQ